MAEVNIMTKVTIQASARLHLGFIDLHGGLGRMYGSLGVSLQQPTCVVEVTSEETGLIISGNEQSRVTKIVERLIDHFDITQGLRITVRESIPRHAGLGSGTQLGLAIGSGITHVAGIKTTALELAKILKRGTVSGVGSATFTTGGFVVDGGKSKKELKDGDVVIPPLIIRHDVPKNWCFVVAIPEVPRGLSGVREKQAFQKLPSGKPESAEKASRLLVMKLLPAIMNDDINEFGDALTQIQILVGDAFASAQGGRFASPEIAKCVKAMLDAGAKGAGQSSWGPACYGLTSGSKAASGVKKVVQEVLDAESGGPVFISKANNQGAQISIS
jgi:beta-RFAP synthase